MNYTPQLWFCNACGRDMGHTSPVRALGRRFRVCSMPCAREMLWRETLSLQGKAYYPNPDPWKEP